ncbi:MAG: hypothetical protein ACOYM3_13185 [Terrimicrobiaceae bacterium]
MRSYWKIVATFTSAACLAGCAAMNTGAPPINTAMIHSASGKGQSAETLATGRRLLASRCTGCHALEPIARYTPAEWRTNVAGMAKRAGINAVEEGQITAYLTAARESLSTVQ